MTTAGSKSNKVDNTTIMASDDRREARRKKSNKILSPTRRQQEDIDNMVLPAADEGMPEVAPPIEMPDPIANAVTERKKSLRKQLKRRGRASTIMTQNKETL